MTISSRIKERLEVRDAIRIAKNGIPGLERKAEEAESKKYWYLESSFMGIGFGNGPMRAARYSVFLSEKYPKSSQESVLTAAGAISEVVELKGSAIRNWRSIKYYNYGSRIRNAKKEMLTAVKRMVSENNGIG